MIYEGDFIIYCFSDLEFCLFNLCVDCFSKLRRLTIYAIIYLGSYQIIIFSLASWLVQEVVKCLPPDELYIIHCSNDGI